VASDLVPHYALSIGAAVYLIPMRLNAARGGFRAPPLPVMSTLQCFDRLCTRYISDPLLEDGPSKTCEASGRLYAGRSETVDWQHRMQGKKILELWHERIPLILLTT